MKEKFNRRYILAVYLLIGAVSIILFLVGINYLTDADPIRGFLLNLSSDLAGVVLIFFIVDQFFLLREENRVVQKIEDLRRSVIDRFSPLTNNDRAKQIFSFNLYLQQAKSVDFLGNNLTTILKGSQNRKDIARAVSQGATVRVLIVDMESEAGKLILGRIRKAYLVEQEWNSSYDYLAEIQGRIHDLGTEKGSFEIKFLNWVPSCSVEIIRCKDGNNHSRVRVNPPSYSYHFSQRRTLLLDSVEHKEHYDYFASFFDHLWEKEAYDKVQFFEKRNPRNL